MLVTGATIEDVGTVVFDEVHYMGDAERGTAWEESILLAPRHVRLVCLSATVPNAAEIAEWIRDAHGDLTCVLHDQRAVPLEHRYWLPGQDAEKHPFNVSTVAVDLAKRVFGDLTGKSVLVVGAGKMSTLAARHLYASGAKHIVVTNRSPEKAEALAAEIDGIARPWADLERLLAEADVVISSTGAREPILTRPLFKRVTKARRWRQLVVIDIAVPRDADPAIGEFDGVYVFDIDDLEKVVAANLAERAKAAEHAARIVAHEAGQFEHWLRTQAVVPTIRALRERFARVADGELQKTLDQLARKDHTPAQQREVIQRLVQLLINKLLHQPTTALREAPPDEAGLRAEILCQLFDLSLVSPAEPAEADERPDPQPATDPSGEVPTPRDSASLVDRDIAEPASSERKAAR